jgi:hypothetical protein
MTMTTETRSEVSRQLAVEIVSFQILFDLRLKKSNAENLMINSRDIYNMKIQLRRDNLESLTLIQILMRELNEKN